MSQNTKPLVVFHNDANAFILQEISTILQRPYIHATNDILSELQDSRNVTLLGVNISKETYVVDEVLKSEATTLFVRCVDEVDTTSSQYYDFEFLFTNKPFNREYLVRYLTFILGKASIHESILAKTRSTFLVLTLPDLRIALPNIETLTIGADAIELRVDLLKDSLGTSGSSEVPSVEYVGLQLMLLRQKSSLPIVFTVRCANEGGRFPMDQDDLAYQFGLKGIQWGVEYLDVEIRLSDSVQTVLSSVKKSTKIISSFHNMSGTLSWSSEHTNSVYEQAYKYGDIVKIIGFANTLQDNYALEKFRQSKTSDKPLLAINAGPEGQVSRALNSFFSPTAHPLLPVAGAPGQLSAAEINGVLSSLGQIRARKFYFLGETVAAPWPRFFQSNIRRLGLPHSFDVFKTFTAEGVNALMAEVDFGGAVFGGAVPVGFVNGGRMAEDAGKIGFFDTIRKAAAGAEIVFENSEWKAIHATLCSRLVPSAFEGKNVAVLGTSYQSAAATIYALKSLKVSNIYTTDLIFTQANAEQKVGLAQISSLVSLDSPLAIISTSPDKITSELLRLHGGGSGGLFIDLASAPEKDADLDVAAGAGFATFTAGDVAAAWTLEVFKKLLDQAVPYNYVRLACGRGVY
ncbi:hypothetical protein RUND412_006940 [Rhizina undulata]